MLMERSQVPAEDKWNVEALFLDFNRWTEELKTIYNPEHTPRWPKIQEFQGKLGESPETLKKALDEVMGISRKISFLYTYAHLRYDEDITHDQHKSDFSKITTVIHEFSQETAWFEPELLALPDETIRQYLSSPVLADYRFHLEKIVRVKKHTLSPEMEELMALSGKSLQTSYKAFNAINDADFKFGTVLDSHDQPREMTHGTYGVYLRDRDRTLRENAFKKMHETYFNFENTLCELLNGQIQTHLFNAKARHYTSCLEAALYSKNIDVKVYRSLIEAVHKKIGTLHRYVNLRKKIMGVDTLHLYDMYVPLTPNVDIQMPYSEAEDIVIESVTPLGAEYQNYLKKGFKQERWVDRFENKNKRSGAYSSGCYGSMPYILMNYKKLLRDVFTLAHEAGHSMHSLYSHKHQPYHYGDYSIFVAEVASTFNEELLHRLLLERCKTKEEKIYLINQKIEDIRGTLFRQTMFAEFELTLHEMAENNIPLTPKILKEKFLTLNQFYFGKDAFVDPEIEIEWARIPHFYYNFYVFQYATGISAALALADKVVNEGEKAREAYLSFLKGGSSRYPIDLLQVAGVDMRTSQPVEKAIDKFDHLITKLEDLL